MAQRPSKAARPTLGNADRARGYVTLDRRQFWSARPEEYLPQRRPVDLGLRHLSRPELSGAAALRRCRAHRGGGLFAGRLAGADLDRDGAVEATAAHKFRAAIVFYPPCLAFKGNMTVPTLILIGANDDWTPAQECRNMVDGRDDWGSRSRRAGRSDQTRGLSRRLSRLRCRGPQNTHPIFRPSPRIQPGGNRPVDQRRRDFLETEIGDKARVE